MLRRCFELAGVVPLAIYTLVHVGGYASALFGRDAFGVAAPDAALTLALEVLLVWLPLAFHTGYGLWLSRAPLEKSEPERRTAILLRATGVLALAFIALHAVWLWAPLLRGERVADDAAQMLAASLSQTAKGVPWFAALHLLGLGAVSLHLSFGLERFVAGWGIAGPRGAQRFARAISLVLFLTGSATVVEFAAGSAVPVFLH